LAVIHLTGYFDEGGTHWDSEVVVVGGYVNPERDWRRLEIKWRRALRKEQIPYFHATDLEANPPRGIYKDWSRLRADRFADRMATIACDHAGRAFAVNMPKNVWLEAVHFMTHHLVNKPHKLPYFILTKSCIDLVVSEAAPKLESGETVAFVFEDNDQMKDVTDGYRLVKQTHPFTDKLGSLGFASKGAFAGLQAADMLAWHYRRATQARLKDRRDLVHRLSPMILRRDDVFRTVPLKMLQDLVIEAARLLDQDLMRAPRRNTGE
jgi:Protein of unknown function (DUF3800)